MAEDEGQTLPTGSTILSPTVATGRHRVQPTDLATKRSKQSSRASKSLGRQLEALTPPPEGTTRDPRPFRTGGAATRDEAGGGESAVEGPCICG
jgi:hypothetical protein